MNNLGEAVLNAVKGAIKDTESFYIKDIVICPYCNYEDDVSDWSYEFELNEETEHECESCEKKYLVLKEIGTYIWSAYKDPMYEYEELD